MPRPSIYPFGYPGLPRILNLQDHLGERRRHLATAVKAVDDKIFDDERLWAEVAEDLVTRFRHEPLDLGETTLDEEVPQARVPTTDPRFLRPGQQSTVVTVDVHLAVISVEGDHSLLSYWPPNVQGPEPSERNFFDPRDRTIRVPVYQELGDTSGTRTASYLTEQDALLRKLVEATNAAVDTWNRELPALVDTLLDRRAAEANSRASVRSKLGFPIKPTSSRPVRYRLPRPAERPRKPKVVEGGDYPLLDDDDFAEVMGVIRRWADFIPEHPEVVRGKNEEALRDDVLHDLNTRGWSATGETFSKLGKSDIRVVVDTALATGVSDIVFKAECKVWDDAGAVSDAFVQLTERYLTGRETRAALIMFIRHRSDFRHARERAIRRLIDHHGAVLVDNEVAGWPLLDAPHPRQPETTIRIVVALVDVSQPGSD